MYDPIAEINTLRMNGYVVKSISDTSFMLNDKLIINTERFTIHKSGDLTKFWKWKPHNLIEKIKFIEYNPKLKTFNLVFYIGSRKVETVDTNKPYAILSAKKKAINHRYTSGTLKIEPTQ